MAVLIRDMEMPRGCCNCPLSHDYECELTGNCTFNVAYSWGVDYYQVRPDWCPLQEVTLVAGMYKTQRGEANE